MRAPNRKHPNICSASSGVIDFPLLRYARIWDLWVRVCSFVSVIFLLLCSPAPHMDAGL